MVSLSDTLVGDLSRLEAGVISTPIYKIAYDLNVLPWMNEKQLTDFYNFHSEQYSWIDVVDYHFLKTRIQ